MLDFGSQTSHLILRRLRAINVYTEMLPCTTKLADLTWKPKGIILSGGKNPISARPVFLSNKPIGPSSVYDKDSPRKTPLPSGYSVQVS